MPGDKFRGIARVFGSGVIGGGEAGGKQNDTYDGTRDFMVMRHEDSSGLFQYRSA